MFAQTIAGALGILIGCALLIGLYFAGVGIKKLFVPFIRKIEKRKELEFYALCSNAIEEGTVSAWKEVERYAQTMRSVPFEYHWHLWAAKDAEYEQSVLTR